MSDSVQVNVVQWRQDAYNIQTVNRNLLLEIKNYMMTSLKIAIQRCCVNDGISIKSFMEEVDDSISLRNMLAPYLEEELLKSRSIGGKFVKELFKHDKEMFNIVVGDILIMVRDSKDWEKSVSDISEELACYGQKNKPVLYKNYCDGFYSKNDPYFAAATLTRFKRRGRDKSPLQKAKDRMAEFKEGCLYVLKRKMGVEFKSKIVKTRGPKVVKLRIK